MDTSSARADAYDCGPRGEARGAETPARPGVDGRGAGCPDGRYGSEPPEDAGRAGRGQDEGGSGSGRAHRNAAGSGRSETARGRRRTVLRWWETPRLADVD